MKSKQRQFLLSVFRVVWPTLSWSSFLFVFLFFGWLNRRSCRNYLNSIWLHKAHRKKSHSLAHSVVFSCFIYIVLNRQNDWEISPQTSPVDSQSTNMLVPRQLSDQHHIQRNRSCVLFITLISVHFFKLMNRYCAQFSPTNVTQKFPLGHQTIMIPLKKNGIETNAFTKLLIRHLIWTTTKTNKKWLRRQINNNLENV